MIKILVFLLLSHAAYGKEISITSYNTWLLPSILMKAHKPNQRSKAIAKYFKENQFDIIALQEVFRKKYYNNINFVLKNHGYYSTGSPEKRFFKVISSGLVIFSKYPIEKKKYIKFRRCSGFDCYAAKGALAARINIDGTRINVLTTHMQAGGSTKKSLIRKSQIDQIVSFLEDEFFQNNYPTILLGDFNISKFINRNFIYLNSVLDLRPHNYIGDLFFTSDGKLNEHKRRMGKKDRKSVDYIFMLDKNNSRSTLSNIIYRPRALYNNKNKLDLSDHFPVKTLIQLDD